MDCGKHKDNIVLHGFSEGECDVCGRHIDTAHTPCDQVCERCSDDLAICQVCGDGVGNDITIYSHPNASILKKNNRRIYLVEKKNGVGYDVTFKRLHERDVSDDIFAKTSVVRGRISIVTVGLTTAALIDLRLLIDVELDKKGIKYI